jgi:hypothetical protein
VKVWSLTTDTDCGLDTALYLTEWQAYEALGREFLAEEDLEHTEYHNTLHNHGIDAAKDWMTKWFDNTGSIDSYSITEHNHPWTFGPEE